MREDAAALFRHVSADKAKLYRQVMDVFAAARRQFRLQLRPDEILAEGAWDGSAPSPDEIGATLAQLTAWGNLESQPDTARVASLNDFYRARFLYRLSHGGEAVETALEAFSQTMRRKAELQSVALDDISTRLLALQRLAADVQPDVAKVHEVLRDLVQRFEGLAENARGFMAGVARGVELQHADAAAVVRYKRRLIDYIERFISEFIGRSDSIARSIDTVSPAIEHLLWLVADREALDAAPADTTEQLEARSQRWLAWRERWKGLRGWFRSNGHEPPQAELLRARARAAVPQLLAAIGTINERRSGRSDRSADFRMLAHWFAACEDDSQSHRLARAAFALNSARHFCLNPAGDEETHASTPWVEAPPLKIHPRLREYGEAAPRGPLPRVRDRTAERAALATQLAEEARQVEAARARLCTGRPTRLSELGELDLYEFDLFLSILGDALSEQEEPDSTVERQTGDGLLLILLKPLAADSRAVIRTPNGHFSGRDHVLTITSTETA
jgi:uncharacterized protein (TIGR02677 family)